MQTQTPAAAPNALNANTTATTGTAYRDGDTKYCVECKHCKAPAHYNFFSSDLGFTCLHPAYGRNIVTGKPTVVPCSQARYPEPGNCGLPGQLFEARATALPLGPDCIDCHGTGFRRLPYSMERGPCESCSAETLPSSTDPITQGSTVLAEVAAFASTFPSSNDPVRSQPGQSVSVSRPVGFRAGGYEYITVEIYALGVGVSIKGDGSNLASTEGTFELEGNKMFVFNPLSACKAYGVVTPVKRNVPTIFLTLQGMNKVYGSEIKNRVLHSDAPLKTVILYLPPGYGKTTIADQLAKRLGCKQIVEEWCDQLPLTPGALHLTNAPMSLALENVA